jgi:hypothetical protein
LKPHLLAGLGLKNDQSKDRHDRCVVKAVPANCRLRKEQRAEWTLARACLRAFSPFQPTTSFGMDVGLGNVEHSQTASRKAAISWLRLSPLLTLSMIITVYFAQPTALVQKCPSSARTARRRVVPGCTRTPNSRLHPIGTGASHGTLRRVSGQWADSEWDELPKDGFAAHTVPDTPHSFCRVVRLRPSPRVSRTGWRHPCSAFVSLCRPLQPCPGIFFIWPIPPWNPWQLCPAGVCLILGTATVHRNMPMPQILA